MTTWVVLFAVQTLLIAGRRADLHRVLGLLGVVLAILITIVGFATLQYSIVSHHGIKPFSPEFFEAFVAFDGISLSLFAVFVAMAIVLRGYSDRHKRFMLLATLNLLPPAVGRAVALLTHQHVELVTLGFMLLALAAIISVDYARNRRLHPVFLWGGAAMAADYVATFYFQTQA
jgi:hypothetical protein